MRLLNPFSGTDSVAKPWREKGYEVISVDIDPKFNPDICEDSLNYPIVNLIPQVSYFVHPLAINTPAPGPGAHHQT